MNEKSTNAFAITLQYYHTFLRSKLKFDNPQVDSKDPKDSKSYKLLFSIARKYALTPSVLLTDLSTKYGFATAPFVFVRELERLLFIYKPIPVPFLKLLDPLRNSIDEYNSELDINNKAFNPDLVMNLRVIIAPNLTAPTLDNMTKVVYLLPGNEDKRPMIKRVESKATITDSEQSQTAVPVGPPKQHIFKALALSAVTQPTTNTSSSSVSLESPFVLLHHCMTRNLRVRVVVRRKGW